MRPLGELQGAQFPQDSRVDGLGIRISLAMSASWSDEIYAGGDKSQQEGYAFHTMLPAAGP